MLSYSTVKTPHLSTIAPFCFFLKEWILAWYMHSPPALRFFTLSGVCMNAPRYQLLLHPHCSRLGLALHPFSGCTCQKTCSLCWGHALTLHNTPHPSRPAINSLQYFIHKHICCSVFHHKSLLSTVCRYRMHPSHSKQQLCFPKSSGTEYNREFLLDQYSNLNWDLMFT